MNKIFDPFWFLLSEFISSYCHKTPVRPQVTTFQWSGRFFIWGGQVCRLADVACRGWGFGLCRAGRVPHTVRDQQPLCRRVDVLSGARPSPSLWESNPNLTWKDWGGGEGNCPYSFWTALVEAELEAEASPDDFLMTNILARLTDSDGST